MYLPQPVGNGHVRRDYVDFGRKLWGDRYFDPSTRKFSNKPVGTRNRSFVEFCLEPIYKIVSACVGEEIDTIRRVLAEFGATLRPSQV